MNIKDIKFIAVDFDGTLCEYAGNFPVIGSPNIALIERLKELQSNGVQLILWTCREGELLKIALDWIESFGLKFDAVNENAPGALHKISNGTARHKVYANLYIDDKCCTPEEFLKK